MMAWSMKSDRELIVLTRAQLGVDTIATKMKASSRAVLKAARRVGAGFRHGSESVDKSKSDAALRTTCLNCNASACRGPPSGGLWLNVPLVHASVISTYLAKIASDPLLAFFERLVWRGTVSANGNEID
jgi:hypothetical protein